MEPQGRAEPDKEKGTFFWRNPSIWFLENNFSRDFWIYFSAVFFFDAGFCIYFFLFNLYLLDLHFKEQMMGLVGGALTLGSVLVMLPAGMLSKKIGVRPLLIVSYIASPALSGLRAVWMWGPAQIVLALLAGMAISAGTVCYLPTVARFTTEKNRTAAFSLVLSASLGTSALGGIVCGYLPQWLRIAGFSMQAAEVKRLILLISCGVALLGLLPILRLRIPLMRHSESEKIPDTRKGWLSQWNLSPFLVRFVPLMALWSVVLASFTPFANVYLSSHLHVSMVRIGLIFSSVQALQLVIGLLTPLVFRALGLVNGIVAIQLAAGLVLSALALAHNVKLAIALYLVFSAVQWMSSPGLYNLLMSETPDQERSTAAAMTLFCNAAISSAATAGAGILFTRFGYPPVLLGIAALAASIAMLLWILIAPRQQNGKVLESRSEQLEF
jgi:MFS family permease